MGGGHGGDRRWQASESAGTIVDNTGGERGLESTMTVLGVCYRIGGTGFRGCVGFDSLAFPGVTIIDGTNIGAGVGLTSGPDLGAGSSSASGGRNTEITVYRFATISINFG